MPIWGAPSDAGRCRALGAHHRGRAALAHPERRAIEETAVELSADHVLPTRIVDVPVLFNDPWTHETVMRFREHHQDPRVTDLEYAARINGLDGPQALIEALSGSPFIVTMIGFVPGLPFCYQLVPR
jgi:urea carboxylase